MTVEERIVVWDGIALSRLFTGTSFDQQDSTISRSSNNILLLRFASTFPKEYIFDRALYVYAQQNLVV